MLENLSTIFFEDSFWLFATWKRPANTGQISETDALSSKHLMHNHQVGGATTI